MLGRVAPGLGSMATAGLTNVGGGIFQSEAGGVTGVSGDTAFQNPFSYFRKYTQVSEEEALEYARTMWRTINRPNLLENVAPTRGRATLVLRKGPDHKVQRLSLRKL